jgi:hypothetical protein
MARFTYRFNVKKVLDNGPMLAKAMQVLADNQLLVGFTRQTRQDTTRTVGKRSVTTPGGELTNAAIAYIQEHGSPSHNIPPRPFMLPGMRSAQRAIVAQLDRAARQAVNGDISGASQGLHGAGLAAVSGIQSYMTKGVPPPLSPRTLSIRRSQGFRGTKPLIHTGQLRAGVTYTIAPVRRRANLKKTLEHLGEELIKEAATHLASEGEGVAEDVAEAGEGLL